jgi:hypothetical protein
MNNQQQQQRRVNFNNNVATRDIAPLTQVVGQTTFTNQQGQQQTMPITEGMVRKSQTQPQIEQKINRYNDYLDQFLAPELQDYTPTSQVTQNRGTTPRSEFVSPWNKKKSNQGGKSKKTKKRSGRKLRKTKKNRANKK